LPPQNNGMKIEARDYRSGLPLSISIEKGVYKKIERIANSPDSLSFPWIAPGLVDLQINGFGGIDLNSEGLSSEQFEILCRKLFENGCTHFLATIITRPRNSYQKYLQKLNQLHCALPLNCIGFHLEGPFLSSTEGCRGVHRIEWMMKPDLSWLDEVMEASGEKVKLITIAPEIDKELSLQFIRKAVALGSAVAIGHSEASWEIIESAVIAGAKLWTHLGNALSFVVPKFQNVLLDVIASDLPYASLIPDGKHVPMVAFRALTKALGSRVILVSDAMAGAAASPGIYHLGDREIVVDPQGKAIEKQSGRLGGSTLRPFDGVFLAHKMTGIPWWEWWDAYSVRPAEILGIAHGLKEGNEASFCLFDLSPRPNLRELYHKGKKVYSSS